MHRSSPTHLRVADPADTVRRDASATHYRGLGIDAQGSLRTTLALVRDTLGFPSVLLNVIDAHEVQTLCEVGATAFTAPRATALCDTVVRTDAPSVLGDILAQVPNHADMAVGDYRSYLGVPLHGREGLPVGALCVADLHPREITAEQVRLVTDFAAVVEDQLDLARRRQESALTGAVHPHALAAAIDAGEVVPWYQPMVDTTTGAVVGVEALARWQHPLHGVITPDSFVPVAEDSDLVIDLDLAVLGRAMSDLARWRRHAPRLRLSVNLSGKHLRSPRSVDALVAAADAAGIAPSAVDLEITETAAVAADARSGAVLRSLRSVGFGILLDDFGTGFSALEHLLNLPVDGIKIDRSLTAALGSRTGDALVRAVVGMGRDMGLTTVIEGVETAATARRARELGCPTGQGYLWSPPVPAALVLPLALASPGVATA